MSWCWFAALAAPPAGENLPDLWASVPATDREGRPAGLLAAWPRGRKPLREAVRMDARLPDRDGPPAWV
jgi:hypothetical protein